MKNGKWIRVNNGVADVMPDKDCEIWIARCGFGKGWIQKVKYYVEQGYIDWDGAVAYMIADTEESPEPYTIHYANGEIVCREILK